MASPKGALKKIRDARRKEAPPQIQHFQQYKPTYQKLLHEMKTIGGDDAMKELREWMVKEVHRTGHSPKPDAVRKQAQKIGSKRGLSIPDDSPLRDGE